jgi:hypothetical protein
MPTSYEELERNYHARGRKILELERELEELRGGCDDRNHAGLERLIHNIGMGRQVFPDPELGQNVGMLAMIIQGFFDSISERKANAMEACTKMREIIKQVHGTTADINSLKVYKCKEAP